MTLNEDVQRIRDAFVAHRSIWVEWFAFADKTWPPTILPSGASVARALRCFLHASESSTPSKLITKICDLFGIEEVKEGSAPVGQGWAQVAQRHVGLFGPEHDLLIKAPLSQTARRHNVRAHEIAHLFLAGFATQPPHVKAERLALQRTKLAENFCWEFALELCCPFEERQHWSVEFLNGLLSLNERALCVSLRDAELPRLNYLHLRALAGRYRISIRVVIRALDRHSLLDATACAIAVFRKVPNQWTGREATLRLWQRARPTWGHIITNQRAIKQGFRYAQDVFDETENQTTKVHREELTLKKRGSSRENNWVSTQLLVPCAYTCVDVKDEGRYLVAIWPWARPTREI